jgi:IS5 family transposase
LTKTLIDKLHPQVRQSFGHKPQTYRKQARKQFLAVAKKKRLRIDKIRKTISSESRSIPDRIVSLYQAHIRPIVRGKARSNVEFGALARRASARGRSRSLSLELDSPFLIG